MIVTIVVSRYDHLEEGWFVTFGFVYSKRQTTTQTKKTTTGTLS